MTLSAIVAWIFFGLVIGFIGRLLVPGRQAMGWMATIGLGIVGSFAGGFLAYVFTGGDPLQPSNTVMSIIGAILVLSLGLAMRPKRI